MKTKKDAMMLSLIASFLLRQNVVVIFSIGTPLDHLNFGRSRYMMAHFRYHRQIEPYRLRFL